MVKHTQTIRRQIADEFLSVFDHFVILAFKGLRSQKFQKIQKKKKNELR